MLIAEPARRTRGVVLPGVGVENTVAPEIEQGAMPIVGARLEGGVDMPAAGTAKLRIVGVHHHFELLDGLHIRCQIEGAVGGNGRAVQQELVGARAAAVHGERTVHVPGARARESRRPELPLRKADAGHQIHQHVRLPSIEGQLGHFGGVEDESAGGGGGVDQLLMALHGDLLRHLAHFHHHVEIQLVGGLQHDAGAVHGPESVRHRLHVVGAWVQGRNRVNASRVRTRLTADAGVDLGDADRDIRYSGLRRVHDLAQDRGPIVLRVQQQGGHQQTKEAVTHEQVPLTI